MEKVRGVDSCFLFFFSGGEFGLVNWERMNLGVPQVVLVRPWVTRLVSVGCRGGVGYWEYPFLGRNDIGLSSWNPKTRYYLMATVKFSMLFQSLGDSSRSNSQWSKTKQNKNSRGLWPVFVIPALVGQREEDPWVSLASQPRGIIKYQTRENLP